MPSMKEYRSLGPIPDNKSYPSMFEDYVRGSRTVRTIESGDPSNGRPQDPYSFRCAPQVMGASKDAFDFTKQILEVEMNSATDNPLVFPEDGVCISGGNFHGQPVAMGLD